MPAPTDESREVEKRIDLRSLGRLGTALAEGLGAAGVGRAGIAQRITGSVEARCVVCGIGVSGEDLIAAALAPDDGAGLTEKQRRLRLGYCARKSCTADFYTVRLRPVLGLDWEGVWSHVEPSLTPAATPIRVAGPSRGLQLSKWLEPVWRGLRRPLPIAAIGVMMVGMWARSGCRVPGISAPPRVFVVPESSGPKLPAPRP